VPGAWLNQAILGMSEFAKRARLVRIAPSVGRPQSQTARDRDAMKWIARISREQRIWDLRSHGFFRMGAEFRDDYS
jgi:hypothetical protein